MKKFLMQKDKQDHFIYTFALMTVLLALFTTGAAIVAVIVIVAAKEVYDGDKNTTLEHQLDALAGMLGACAALAI